MEEGGRKSLICWKKLDLEITNIISQNKNCNINPKKYELSKEPELKNKLTKSPNKKIWTLSPKKDRLTKDLELKTDRSKWPIQKSELEINLLYQLIQ